MAVRIHTKDAKLLVLVHTDKFASLFSSWRARIAGINRNGYANDFQSDDLLPPFFARLLHSLLPYDRYRRNRRLPDLLLVPAELWESVGSRGRHQKSGRQSFPQYAFCKMTGGKFPIECYKRHKREKSLRDIRSGYRSVRSTVQAAATVRTSARQRKRRLSCSLPQSR